MSAADDLRTVDAERRADVALDIINAGARRWARSNRRPAALTPREALVALEFEALFVSVAAHNLANGVVLSDTDRERLLLAYRRIDLITSEI